MEEQQVYFGDFVGPNWYGRGGKALLESAFNITLSTERILFAYYEYENYSGHAYVLFEQNGKLFEVTGSHCSCYGLEGQWEPSEVTTDAVRHTLDTGSNYYLDNNGEAHKAAIRALQAFETGQGQREKEGGIGV